MNKRLVYSAEQIEKRISELGKIISGEADGPLLCVCVLRGAFMFFAQLLKNITRDVTVDFITLSSYQGDSSTGFVDLIGELRESVEDRDVLIVEDIVDSGRTADYLRRYFAGKKARSVKIACLIDKPNARVVDVRADYIAFTLDSCGFVVGYGLDYDQKYRNLDCIMELCYE